MLDQIEDAEDHVGNSQWGCELLEPRILFSVSPDTAAAVEFFGTSPAVFVENQGQWADDTLDYLFQGDGASIAFRESGLDFQLSQLDPANDGREFTAPHGPHGFVDALATPAYQTTQFSMRFDGANSSVPTGLIPTQTRYNYLVGDVATHRSNVTGYEVVAYENLYDGIDLHTFGRQGSMKYEFYVAPGSDYSQIAVHYEGIEGLYIDNSGAMRVVTEFGELVDNAPYIFQVVDGVEIEVAGAFSLIDANTYTFIVTGEYDQSLELTIDPDLAWSTYLGGSGSESGNGIAVDSSGQAYVTGSTSSAGWATAGAYDTTHNGSGEIFVAKLSADGSALLYATYLGGSSSDFGYGIAVDSSGQAHVTGTTRSAGWATAGAYDTTHNGSSDIFVAKLSADGSTLLYATYLGGSGSDSGRGIAVDDFGRAYVTGDTYSSGWATAEAYDTTHNGGGDIFVARLSADGSGLLNATYLGGGSYDSGNGIAVDPSGHAYVTGVTLSSGWVTAGAYDTTHNGSGGDVFVAKLSADGSALLYATYLGGSNTDSGNSIAADTSGQTYVTGYTWSSNWATAGAYDTTYNGDTDVFVAKLSADGSALHYATYLGGSSGDIGYGITADTSGQTYVTGRTESSNWATAGAFDTTLSGDSDAFVARLSADGSALLYATYLGGSSGDSIDGIAVDTSGRVYVTGGTGSAGLATSGAYDTAYSGGGDIFVARLDFLPVDPSDSLLGAVDLGDLLAGPLMVTGIVGDGPQADLDIDLYRFDLLNTGMVRLDIDAQSTGSPLDAYLRLFNAWGGEIAASDDVNGFDPNLLQTLSAGTYYIGVSGYPNRYYNPNIPASGISTTTTGLFNLTVSLEGGAQLVSASATYDGNVSEEVFGRYLIGDVVEDIWNTFTAYVQPNLGETISAVAFDANFNGIRDTGDYVDSTSADGWTWDLNVSDLDGDKTLSIWAQDSSAVWSSATTFLIDTIEAPAWIDPDLSVVSFNASTGEYEISTLIGEQFGADTPAFFPDWLGERDGDPTFNGVFFGTQIEATSALNGTVRLLSDLPAFGWSVFGRVQTFTVPAYFDGNVSVDLYRFLDVAGGGLSSYFDANTDDRVRGYYDDRAVVPSVTLGTTGNAVLGSDLLFDAFSRTFSIDLAISGALFEYDLPSFSIPLSATPPVTVDFTPHVGFSPHWNVSFSQGLDVNGLPGFESVSTLIGLQGSVGVTTELSLGLGLVSGGLDVTGGFDVGFNAVYDGSWTYSIPASIGLDVDFVGSIGWGLFSGSIDAYDWSTPFGLDLWTSSSSLLRGGNNPTRGGGGGTSVMPVEHVLARSLSGEIAYALTPVSTDGAASPLSVQRLISGIWQAPETIADSKHHRGNPALVSLGGDDWMVMWSQSNLQADALTGLSTDQVIAEQEVWYATRTGGAWTSPTRLTTNTVLDDGPSLIRLDDGTVLAAWRQLSGSDISDTSQSDIVYATWDGTSWSPETTLAAGTDGLTQPALTKLVDGTILATVRSEPNGTPEDATAEVFAFDGLVWTSVTSFGIGSGVTRPWAGNASLDDGSAVVAWTEETSEGVSLWVSTLTHTGSSWQWTAPEAAIANQAVLSNPQLIVDGNIVRVVYHTYGQENEIVGISRDYSDPASTWQADELLSQGNGQAGWAVAAVTATGAVEIRYLLDSTDASELVDAKADLIVTADTLQFIANPPVPGQSTLVEVNVSNSGWASSSATTLTLYDGDPMTGGSVISTQAVPVLQIGESVGLTLAWTPSSGGASLWLRVDSVDAVVESNENNNDLSWGLTVLDAPTLALAPASDTGTPGDGQTVDTTLEINGSAPIGSHVLIYVDTFDAPFATVDVAGTSYVTILPTLGSGAHSLYAQAQADDGSLSAISSPLAVYIDAAILPTPSTPQLAPGSDTGSVGDGITTEDQPTIVGVVKPNAIVMLFDSGKLIAQGSANMTGSYSLVPTLPLSVGVHQLTVVQSDVSGNVSSHSLEIVLQIESDLIAGDITGDGFVGAEDLDQLLATWGDAATSSPEAAAADLNLDGVVGSADLSIVIANWGNGSPASQPTSDPDAPESSTGNTGAGGNGTTAPTTRPGRPGASETSPTRPGMSPDSGNTNGTHPAPRRPDTSPEPSRPDGIQPMAPTRPSQPATSLTPDQQRAAAIRPTADALALSRPIDITATKPIDPPDRLTTPTRRFDAIGDILSGNSRTDPS